MKLNILQLKALQHYLSWRSHPMKLTRFLKSSLKKETFVEKEQAEIADKKRIRAAAVQMLLQLDKDPFTYAARMHQVAIKAAREKCQLVVFPENNGLSLLGLLPGVSKNTGGTTEDAMKNLGNLEILDIFRFLNPVTKNVIMGTFPFLAARYKLYIMAGSFLMEDNNEIVNRAFLFNPQGKLIGTQDKAHLLPLEKKWGVKEGNKFKTFQVHGVRAAMPICMDATYYETFRILEQLGVKIVMVPIANPQPYNYWLALRGIWPRVQEGLVYGIKSSLVGDIFGFSFTGRSGIYAPLELTASGDGVLAESSHWDKEDLVIADLDIDSLVKLRKDHPVLKDENRPLYRKYIPSLYRT